MPYCPYTSTLHPQCSKIVTPIIFSISYELFRLPSAKVLQDYQLLRTFVWCLMEKLTESNDDCNQSVFKAFVRKQSLVQIWLHYFWRFMDRDEKGFSTIFPRRGWRRQTRLISKGFIIWHVKKQSKNRINRWCNATNTNFGF